MSLTSHIPVVIETFNPSTPPNYFNSNNPHNYAKLLREMSDIPECTPNVQEQTERIPTSESEINVIDYSAHKNYYFADCNQYK